MSEPDLSIVDEAELALRAFGVREMDIAVATRLLPLWHYFDRMTATEKVLTLRRFGGDGPRE